MRQLLNDDQRDALQEVSNIAMGQAGSSLAILLGVFVRLSVPRIEVVEMEQINPALVTLMGGDVAVTAVRQAYHGALRGEAIAIFREDGHSDLAELLGHDGPADAATQEELLLDTSNLLIGACMTAIAELLSSQISFFAPSIMARSTPVGELMNCAPPEWKYALLVEVNFTLEARRFSCHLTQFMPEPSIEPLRQSLDSFMAALA